MFLSYELDKSPEKTGQRCAHDGKGVVRQCVCRVEEASQNVPAMTHSCIIAATPPLLFVWLEVLEQQRVEGASELVRSSAYIRIIIHLEKLQPVSNQLCLIDDRIEQVFHHPMLCDLHRKRVFGVTKDKIEQPELVI
jgi:hypothetical protein